MKTIAIIARVLLGLVFTVFGLNGFLHFIPLQPMPPVATQFVGALLESPYMTVIFGLQLVCGVLFLANQYVPLALVVIAPVIANILLFHIFMAPAGLPLGIVVAMLWMVLAYRKRVAFSAIWERSNHVQPA